ncbi:hypothetical protein CFIO01_05274 [Colletotrichum fioriniae PJ7]|uniref:Uncharacterized protein n=1 Tax=Colletotrichum fioriniae PJ7 TaxID=1445577 RepID=A0A010QIZ2_9PEZI|nr:hypothetical protein CFIO01_05274 [Colletotrichum fioriniae PJ7]
MHNHTAKRVWPASLTGQRPAQQGNDFLSVSRTNIYLAAAVALPPSTIPTGQDLPFHRNNIRDISHQMMPKKPTRATPKVSFHISWSSGDGGRGQCPTIQRFRGLPPLSSPTSRGIDGCHPAEDGHPPGWAQFNIPACD